MALRTRTVADRYDVVKVGVIVGLLFLWFISKPNVVPTKKPRVVVVGTRKPKKTHAFVTAPQDQEPDYGEPPERTSEEQMAHRPIITEEDTENFMEYLDLLSQDIQRTSQTVRRDYGEHALRQARLAERQLDFPGVEWSQRRITWD